MLRPRVLFCLFIWPERNAWQPLIDAIRSRPQLDWLIIINPNSGPGDEPPHEDVLRALPLLRQAAAPGQAIELLGYVLTQWTTRSADLVRRDVRQYAGWATRGAEYALNGVYFDETTWHEGAVGHYAALAEYARSLRWDAWKALPAQAASSARSDLVMLNPGCNVHEDYFQFADHVVVHEQTVQSWMPGSLLNRAYSHRSIPAHKFALLLHDGPDETIAPSSGGGFALSVPPHLPFCVDTPCTTQALAELALRRARVGAFFLTSLSLAREDIYASFGRNFDSWLDAMERCLA